MYIMIFTGGSFPDPGKCRPFFDNKDAIQAVIAADSGLETARLYEQVYGIRVDLIVGDMDSLKSKRILEGYPQSCIQRQPEAKAYTDTETALMEAVRIRESSSRGHALRIALIGGDGGRIDHLLGIYRLLGSAVSPDYWLLHDQCLCMLGERFFPRIRLSGLIRGDTISTFSVSCGLLGVGSYKIRSEGLVWPLDNVDWSGWGRSISNWPDTERYTDVSLYAESGVFCTIFPLRNTVLIRH